MTIRDEAVDAWNVWDSDEEWTLAESAKAREVCDLSRAAFLAGAAWMANRMASYPPNSMGYGEFATAMFECAASELRTTPRTKDSPDA